jgi:hypothetical protein
MTMIVVLNLKCDIINILALSTIWLGPYTTTRSFFLSISPTTLRSSNQNCFVAKKHFRFEKAFIVSFFFLDPLKSQLPSPHSINAYNFILISTFCSLIGLPFKTGFIFCTNTMREADFEFRIH